MNFEVIENKRKTMRYTVQELCDKVGIDRKTYYNYQQNPDSIKVSILRKIFSELEISKREQAQFFN